MNLKKKFFIIWFKKMDNKNGQLFNFEKNSNEINTFPNIPYYLYNYIPFQNNIPISLINTNTSSLNINGSFTFNHPIPYSTINNHVYLQQFYDPSKLFLYV